MAYDNVIPVATQSPGVFPAQSQENFTRLKTIIDADHQFNDAVASNDGYHVLSHWVNQGGSLGDDTPTGIASTAQLYTKTLTYLKQAGAASTRQVLMQQPGDRTVPAEETAIGAAPIRAAVSFNTAGTILGAAFNVISVVYSLGTPASYAVTFDVANPMPLATYLVIVSRNGGTCSFTTVVSKATTGFTIQAFNVAGTANLTAACDVIVLGGWAET
jgi:hypothetical protein